MPTITFNETIIGGGVNIASTPTVTSESVIGHEVTLPAALAGTLTTRTGDDAGVVTVAEGHGITDSNTVNVFWEGGMVSGMTVVSSDGTTVTVDGGGAEYVLPDQDTVVYIAAQVDINTDFLGTDVEAIALWASARAHADLRTDAATSWAMELAANSAVKWTDQGITNPITGDQIDVIRVSAGTDADTTFKAIAGYDSVA